MVVLVMVIYLLIVEKFVYCFDELESVRNEVVFFVFFFNFKLCEEEIKVLDNEFVIFFEFECDGIY